MKRKFTVLILLFVLVFSVGCGTQATVTKPEDTNAKKTSGFVVGYSNGYFGNDFRAQLMDEVKLALDNYKKNGILSDYIMSNANSDQEQIATINDMINKKVDGIFVDARNADALTPVIAKARAQGIVVVTGEGNFADSIRVEGDNQHFMAAVTQFVVDHLNGKGNLAFITGLAGTGTDNERTAAVTNVVKKAPGMKIIAQSAGDWAVPKTSSVMTNLLAAYPNIDGVIAEEGAQGVLQAYKAANKPLPVMVGEYTFGYLRAWAKTPGLVSIVNTFPPGLGYDQVGVLVRLLQGRKLKPEVLQQSFGGGPNDKQVTLPMPYIVVRQLEPNAAWMKELDPRTKVITLDEALKMGEGKPDNALMDGMMTEQQLDDLFQP